MPRIARVKSRSKVYHIMIRGINKQDIFYDKQDYLKFLKELKTTKEKYKYKIYAYCLMPNHVHLEIYDFCDCMENIMKSLTISYSNYFNKKYERVGHLFQNRYLSKEVEDTQYLLDLQRYIHQNPKKAGISKTEDYKWSSYKDYIYEKGITDTSYIMEKFSSSKKEFARFNQQIKNEIEQMVKFEIKHRITDEEANEIIKKYLKIENLQELQKYSKKVKEEMLRPIKGIEKIISISQMSRIMGIDRKNIERMLKT